MSHVLDHELAEAREKVDELFETATMSIQRAPEPPKARVGFLVVLKGGTVGQVCALGGSVVLGRSEDADISLPDGGVSRNHARISREENGNYQLVDLGSRNGTWVNGERLERAHLLSDGDRIQLGKKTCFKFVRHDEFEQQLQESQKMEAVGQLAQGIAHDFNNLLTVISANVSYLTGVISDVGMVSCAELSETLDDMSAATQRAAGLVQQLLGFARKAKTSHQSINVGDLVGEIAQLARRTFASNIRMRTEVEPGVVVQGDRNALEQAILNLCLNARDAIQSRRGTISITVAREDLLDEQAAKLHGSLHGGPYARIEVRDDGTGMDPRTRKRAFEPFFTTKEVGKGSGLGLAMVYGIAKSHLGHVEIESEENEGATIRIYLPMVPATDDAPVVRAPPADEQELGGEQILIVDYEAGVRRTLSRVLRKMGYGTLEATGGKEAVALYEQHRANVVLVLLDLSTADMSGEETFRALRAKGPSVKVLVISGNGEEEAEQVLADGASHFLRKPFERIELATAVQAALQGR